jgi:TolB protein
VFIVPVDGSAAPRLFIDDGGAADAAWSHDGKLIAYDGQRSVKAQLFVMNSDGTTGRRQVLPTTHTQVDPSWSPDDRRILYDTDIDGNFELHVVNADGTGDRRLTNDPGKDLTPAW